MMYVYRNIHGPVLIWISKLQLVERIAEPRASVATQHAELKRACYREIPRGRKILALHVER